MQDHHVAWLAAHPERSAEWLRARLADGFHVHHIDGDHGNNDPANLLLIDGADHMRLHGMDIPGGIARWRVRNGERSARQARAKKAEWRPNARRTARQRAMLDALPDLDAY